MSDNSLLVFSDPAQATITDLHNYSPVPWPSIFPGRGRVHSSTITVPAKILPCERFQTRKDICGENFGKNLRGCSTHAVQNNTLLVHASAQKNSAMELLELQTRGRGQEYSSPYPGKYSAMELGCYTAAFRVSVLNLDYNILKEDILIREFS